MEAPDRKSYVSVNEPLMAILFMAQNEKKRGAGKVCILLDNTEVIQSRINCGNWVVKAILTKPQKGMRNMLARQCRQGDLFYKLLKNLAELCSYLCVLWKAELYRNKIGYFIKEAKEFSRKRIEKRYTIQFLSKRKLIR